VLVGRFLEYRRERAARPTPLRPEIEQHDSALLDRFLEVVCRDFDGRHCLEVGLAPPQRQGIRLETACSASYASRAATLAPHAPGAQTLGERSGIRVVLMARAMLLLVDMSAEQKSQVVVAYDFSKSGHLALTRAATLAVRAPWHVLQIVVVVDPHYPFPSVPTNEKVDINYADRVQQVASQVVADELFKLEPKQPVHFFVHARIGKPVDEILDVARSVGADIILIGSHNITSVERWMLGSVAERVAREAGCSVEVVKDKTYSYVPLLEVVDTPHQDHPYVPPHRYTYQDRRAERRPNDWPLY
jgi:nucleotide-binding universal stress UspA family protein